MKTISKDHFNWYFFYFVFSFIIYYLLILFIVFINVIFLFLLFVFTFHVAEVFFFSMNNPHIFYSLQGSDMIRFSFVFF